MELKKVIIRNLLTGWVGRSISIISTIIVTAILIKHFGKYEYGIWVTIGQGASLFGILDFGIANSVGRFIAKNLALENHEENLRVFSTSLAIFFFSSVLVLIIVIAILPFIPSIFNIVESHRRIAFWLFGLTGVNTAIVFPLRVGHGLLESKDRYDLIYIYETGFSLLRLILIILIFGRGKGDLILLALITVGLNLSLEMTLFGMGMKQHHKLRFKYQWITIKNFKEITSLGSSSLLKTLSGSVFNKAQIIAVGIILGMSSSTLYTIPVSVINKIAPFISRLGGTFTPIASRMEAKGEMNRLQTLNVLGVRYGLALSLPIGIFLMFYGKGLLTLWLGRSELMVADFNMMAFVLAILAIPFALGWPQIASSSILRGTGKHWLVANGTVFSSIIGLSTSILIMHYSNWGILGAALGWALRYFLSNILLFPFFICRYLNMNGWYYFKRVYLSPIICALILVIVCVLFNGLLPSATIFYLIIKVILYWIITYILIICISFLPEHRKYLFNIIRKRIPLL